MANNDNLYNLEDEKEEMLSGQPDTYVLNEEEYVLEDDPDIEASIYEEDENDNEAWQGESAQKQEKRKSLLSTFFRILSNPTDGWKSLKRSKFGEDKVARCLFYPVLALASVSELTELFYNADGSDSSLVATIIITFITFFFSYFTVLIGGGLMLPKVCGDMLRSNFGKEYVMINITTLAMFYLLYRLFPLAGPIIGFLPLLTVYIAYKGIKLLRIPYEKETYTGCVIVGLLIGSPLLWNWIFTDLLKFI